MATDGEFSFVFFIYGDIQWGNRATIGFNAGDGLGSFQITRPRDTRNIETSSNVGIPGVYIFRVDQSTVMSQESKFLMHHDSCVSESSEIYPCFGTLC